MVRLVSGFTAFGKLSSLISCNVVLKMQACFQVGFAFQ